MSTTTDRHDLDAWLEPTDRRIGVLAERAIRIARSEVRERGRLITARQGEGKAES
jgi:hypothetical protein